MSIRTSLLSRLATVEKLSQSGKLSRLIHAPARYLTAIGFDRLVYGRTKKPLLRQATTFYGQTFSVALPAGTDIYLTGGKTHISELRLSRFLIRYLPAKAHYVDVGGHYGFFAGLAEHILENEGKITVFEPAPDTFGFLSGNLSGNNIDLRQMGLADKEDTLTFYQFPARYSEYNSLDIEQYAGEDWIKDFPASEVAVPIGTLDVEFPTPPDWLKIDVEGAEDRVIKGGQRILSQGKTVITMEYLPAALSNGSHRKAADLLQNWGYQIYFLNDAGDPVVCPEPELALAQNGQDSANLVFSVHPLTPH